MNSKHLPEIKEILSDLEPKEKALPYLELESMMLSQVVEVAQLVSQNDINNTHVQNWVRRKYIPSPLRKKYSREQVANILLINDLRNILPLEEISQLLGFVNENLLDSQDDRINPTKLYHYYAEVFDNMRLDWQKSLHELQMEVEKTIAEEEIAPDDREKVAMTLVVLNLLARANLYKQIAERWLARLKAEEEPKD